MSSTLRDVQWRVQNFLLHPEHRIDDLIKPAGTAPVEVRTGIYAEAYHARLVAALASDYAGLHGWLGDDSFTELVHVYVDKHPSRYFSLRELGGALAEFVATTAPYREHPDVADMASFEWAQCAVFDAADAVSVTVEQLARIDPSAWLTLQLRLQPALQCISLRSNVPAIWSALNADEVPPALKFSTEPATWLVWRQDLRLLFRELTAVEAWTLKNFADGGNFADACAGLAEMMPDEAVPGHVAGLLRRWIEAGLIAEIATSVD